MASIILGVHERAKRTPQHPRENHKVTPREWGTPNIPEKNARSQAHPLTQGTPLYIYINTNLRSAEADIGLQGGLG